MVEIYPISHWERIRNTLWAGLEETHMDTGQIHTGPEGIKPTAFARWDIWAMHMKLKQELMLHEKDKL